MGTRTKGERKLEEVDLYCLEDQDLFVLEFLFRKEMGRRMNLGVAFSMEVKVIWEHMKLSFSVTRHIYKNSCLQG